jgi:dihydroflavonol-4-reductase
MLRSLVTGAAGFIGSHLVRVLLDAGHEVRALHLPGESLDNLAELGGGGRPLTLVAGDVTEASSMREAVAGMDRVFHVAALYELWSRDPGRMDRINVGGTRTVLEEAARAGVPRVVYTSSIARFGGQGPGRRATEESPFALGTTGDRYARSKAEAHEVALEQARRGLDVVIVAPTGPIGPGDIRPTPTGRLLQTAASLPVCVVTRTVTNFADVRDIARGHLLAAEKGRQGESYLLGNQDLSLAELGRLAHRVRGVRRPVVEVPAAVALAAGHAALAVAERTGRQPLLTPAAVRIAELGLAADCSKAVRELGLPQTPLEVALRDAFAWWNARARRAAS